MLPLFLSLGLLLLGAACSPKSNWKHSQIDGESSEYCSSRLSYSLNTHNTLQMEIIQRKGSCRGYLFVQGRRIPEAAGHPKKALLSLEIGEDNSSYLVDRYEGGHRLSLSDDLLQKILKALESGEEVSMQASGYHTTLDPNGFSALFKKGRRKLTLDSFVKTSF